MDHTTNKFKLLLSLGLGCITIMAVSWVGKNAAKPTFKERVMAEVDAGKKVAVFTNLQPLSYDHSSPTEEALCKIGEGLVRKAQTTAGGFTFTRVFEEKTPLEYDMSDVVADQLNKEIGTDAFVVVAQGGVGTKTIAFMGVETEVQDWWNSDYDIIVEIIIGARYTTSLSAGPFNTKLMVSPLMYVREVVEGKDALGFLVNGRNLGNNFSETVEHANCFSSYNDLVTNIGAPDGLVRQTKEAISAPLAKFIAKENAKYDKAMKKKK